MGNGSTVGQGSNSSLQWLIKFECVYNICHVHYVTFFKLIRPIGDVLKLQTNEIDWVSGVAVSLCLFLRVSVTVNEILSASY